MTRFIPLSLMLLGTACQHDPPQLAEYPVGSVTLVEKSDALPRSCISRGRIYAEDGWVGKRRWAYRGTEERALHRLRNEAVRANANLVVLDRRAFVETIALDDARGHAIRVEGEAYLCEQVHRTLPN